MTVLRNPNLFSAHRHVLASHQMGRYIMDIDQLLVNYARGFVLHLELKHQDERDMCPKQFATIAMVCDVWNSAPHIRRCYDDGTTMQVHDLKWRGFYIFRAGDSDEFTNEQPWSLVIVRGTDEPVQEFGGDSGAVRALSDIARGVY
jgi:hypothetical protein